MTKRLIYHCFECGLCGTPIEDDGICGNCNSDRIEKLTDYDLICQEINNS